MATPRVSFDVAGITIEGEIASKKLAGLKMLKIRCDDGSTRVRRADQVTPLNDEAKAFLTSKPSAAREPLTPGDPVTLVLPDHVVMVEVTTSSREGFACTLTSRKGNSIVSEHRLGDEGVTWLLGYYLADSPEVLACRVAKAVE